MNTEISEQIFSKVVKFCSTEYHYIYILQHFNFCNFLQHSNKYVNLTLEYK